MTHEQLTEKYVALDERVTRHTEQIKTAFNQINDLKSLAESVKDLAMSVQLMAHEQKDIGKKVDGLATMPDVPGILLFKSGHVGVYVGNGYAVEAQSYAYGVVKTKVSKRPWTEWAYLPASLIDYGDASSVTDNTPAVTPEVKPTTRKLGDRTLKRTSPMMTGDDVAELQTRLNALGFDCGEVDGKFGKNTENGVIAFQTAAGIEVDGKFGKESFAALSAYSTPENEPESDDAQGYATYVVQRGDTLWNLAKKLLGRGGRWTEIAALNNISGTMIRDGQVLKIPALNRKEATD